jgi:hypothetical protein
MNWRNNDLMQVLFIFCAVLVNKSGWSLSRKIRRVFSNVSLFPKKICKQRGHLCYMYIGLRFTTYEYPPPLLTLRSLFIVSLKSISETVVSLKSTLTSTFTTYDLKWNGRQVMYIHDTCPSCDKLKAHVQVFALKRTSIW